LKEITPAVDIRDDEHTMNRLATSSKVLAQSGARLSS
jgi:hypothetical protein